MLTAIEKIQKHAKKIASGKDPNVKPGQPERFTDAATVGDCIVQGDLYLVVADNNPPEGYKKVESPKESDCQLVPGNTQGSKHCLDSLDGVVLFRPEEWNEDSLEGPCLQLTEERTVLHPVHGAVIIPGGMNVICHYQREWDREQAKERRARD